MQVHDRAKELAELYFLFFRPYPSFSAARLREGSKVGRC